jgi:hypothetical protein
MKLAIAALVLMLRASTFAQTATDGDTLKAEGVTRRLWGIDAPEPRHPQPTREQIDSRTLGLLLGLLAMPSTGQTVVEVALQHLAIDVTAPS